MTSPYRITGRLLAFAALAGAPSLALPGRAAAQEDEAPRFFCLMGRPQPTCERMLFAQFTYYPHDNRFSELGAPLEWEVGALVNRGPEEAVGGTVVLGVDGSGVRTAVKARYRRWIGRYTALDAAGGLAVAQRRWTPSAPDDRAAFGVTGDVTLGLTDWASVGIRADLLWSNGEPVSATYGAVRLGTLPGVVVSVLGYAFLRALSAGT
jgi:hypothetical protein